MTVPTTIRSLLWNVVGLPKLANQTHEDAIRDYFKHSKIPEQMYCCRLSRGSRSQLVERQYFLIGAKLTRITISVHCAGMLLTFFFNIN